MKKFMLFLGLFFGCNEMLPSGFDNKKSMFMAIGATVVATITLCKLYDSYKLPVIVKQKVDSPVEMVIDAKLKKDRISDQQVLETIDVAGVSFIQVPVLQQDSSKPFILRGKNIEEVGEGEILGIPGHTWKQVRTAESLNCGEHTIKNMRILMEMIKQILQLCWKNSAISQELLDRGKYIQELALMTPIVFASRMNQINQALGACAIKNPADTAEVENAQAILKAQGNSAAGNIHASQRYIKTDFLSGEEMQKILTSYAPSESENIFVLEYQPRMQGIANRAFPMFTESMEERLAKFKSKANDFLGICWTEEGYPHWIGFVAVKNEGKLEVYEMNSLVRLQPNHREVVVDLLK